MIGILNKFQDMLDMSRAADFLGPLALRLYLAPVFWVAGSNKMNGFEDVVSWFGNAEWGLGLPMPWLMAFMATSTEIVGAVMLLLGFGVRWISLPLMMTMIVAMLTVHLEHGWQAIAGAKSPWASGDIAEAGERLEAARSILQEHGNYDWLTSSGSFVISNNGIEWAATYFIMLLVLLFIGSGKYVSVDYWVAKKFRQ